MKFFVRRRQRKTVDGGKENPSTVRPNMEVVTILTGRFERDWRRPDLYRLVGNTVQREETTEG